MADLRQRAAKGVAWALMERFTTQLMGFVVAVVLSRLLAPSDYGTIALLSIFFAVSSVVIGGGFTSALIQKKEATELDFNSVFYIQLLVSLATYAILFASAPRIAEFYQIPELSDIMRVVSVTVVFLGINGVQNAELSRKMKFNASFKISLLQSLVSGVVGVAMAIAGYGVWALACSSVLGAFTGMMSRWFIIAWRPRLMFSWAAVKGLFRYGWKMAAATMLDTAYDNLYGLFIGKIYTKSDLAFFNKGHSVPKLAMDSINGTLCRVAFPALSQLQDRRDSVREAMRKMIKSSTFLVFPLMAGCAVCAPTLTPLLFGDQWMPAVPYVQVACFQFALWPFHTVNLQAIASLGRSDLFLMLEIVKKTFGLLVLLVSLRYGPFAFACAMAFVAGPFSVAVNAYPNKRLLGYTVWMQLRDVAPTALVSAVMFAACWGVSLVFAAEGNTLRCLMLLLQMLTGVIVFILVAAGTRVKAADDFLLALSSVCKGKSGVSTKIEWLIKKWRRT